jgi:hypothetical protein
MMSTAFYAQEAEWYMRLARTCPNTEQAAQLEAQARLFLKLARRRADKQMSPPADTRAKLS